MRIYAVSSLIELVLKIINRVLVWKNSESNMLCETRMHTECSSCITYRIAMMEDAIVIRNNLHVEVDMTHSDIYIDSQGHPQLREYSEYALETFFRSAPALRARKLL